MKTLGIFGDSFADDTFGHNDFVPEGNQWAWFHYIPDHIATTHGRGGSNLYYTYKQFLEHHSKYDKIVVILTQYERISEGFFYLEEISAHHPIFLPSPEQIEYYLKKYKKLLTIHDTNKLKAIREFYLWCRDDEICYDMGMLMIDKIKQIRPDAILINAFYQGQGNHKGQNKFPLVTGPTIIEYLDAMIRGIIPDVSDVRFPHLKVQARSEIRTACHLSKEANLVLGKDVYHALVTGVWNPIVPYAIPHENLSLDYYYDQKLW